MRAVANVHSQRRLYLSQLKKMSFAPRLQCTQIGHMLIDLMDDKADW